MAKIAAVYSMKDGVGKTTLAVHLAYCPAAQSSWQTLLWDSDGQRAASFLGNPLRPFAKASRVSPRVITPSDRNAEVAAASC